MRARRWLTLWPPCAFGAAVVMPDWMAKSHNPRSNIPISLVPQIESTIDSIADHLVPLDPFRNHSAVLNPQLTAQADTTGPPLAISLVNNTTATDVYAYLTGTAPNGSLFFLRPDGQTLYFPSSTSADPVDPAEDINIKLPGPGQALNVSVPSFMNGGRIWFSLHHPLKFGIAPGSQLVTPTAANDKNSNYNTTWGFCELSYNAQELYVNISFVDFVSISISLILESVSAGIRRVVGLPRNVTLDALNSRLVDQAKVDGQPWDKLAVRNADTNEIMRVLSPANALVLNNTLFAGYFDAYNDAVWSAYTSGSLTVNTQSSYGNLAGVIGSDQLLNFYNPNITGNVPSRLATSGLNATTLNATAALGAGVLSSFGQPNSSDVFSCSTGPFATNDMPDIGLAILPRLAAAWNRGTLIMGQNGTNVTGSIQPDGVPLADYYPQNGTTFDGKHLAVPMNHYARIVHELEVDGQGYAFPYDDVVADGGRDVSGALMAADPKVLTVVVGGIE